MAQLHVVINPITIRSQPFLKLVPTFCISNVAIHMSFFLFHFYNNTLKIQTMKFATYDKILLDIHIGRLCR